MKIINEVKKTDDLYFMGPFWLVAPQFKGILRGKFRLIGERFLCDYKGNDLSEVSKNSQRHKSLWNRKIKSQLNSDKEFDYYPRGRVTIYNGTAFIHLNSLCNTPYIIGKVIDYYEINKLDIEIELNDQIQGSHYNFKLI